MIKKIDGLNINFKFQDVSNDNYLKLHNLSNTSDLIVDESLLTTELNISKDIDQNTKINSDFIIYEDLTKRDSDKFQYICQILIFKKYKIR